MKHYSKRARLKAKKVNAQPKTEELSAGRPAERPTAERMARGVWTEPKGMGKNEIPVTDVTADMIGLLLFERRITDSQEQAARVFQAARWDYLHELPEVSGYKSCLAGEVPGFDDSSGDPKVIEAYRSIEKAVGWKGRRELLWVCDEGQKPRDIDLLRWALTAISDMK